MAEHSCSRALTANGRRTINIECACGWVGRVEGTNAHDALVKALDRFADHCVVQAGVSDGG